MASVGYERETRTLEVEFSSGAVYRYFGVPEHEADGLVGADSVGRCLNESIKGHYRYAKV